MKKLIHKTGADASDFRDSDLASFKRMNNIYFQQKTNSLELWALMGDHTKVLFKGVLLFNPSNMIQYYYYADIEGCVRITKQEYTRLIKAFKKEVNKINYKSIW